MKTPRTFDEVATAQGWNADSREQVLKDFIATGGSDLDDYAQKRAFEENEGSEFAEPLPTVLPQLTMEVAGEYQGNAYPEAAEYRVVMVPVDWESGDAVLVVEGSSGEVINSVTITAEDADGILKVAETDHSLAVYEDDWKIPSGIERTVAWDVGGYSHHVILSAGHIDEIAAWLRFATGVEDYEGDPENWEW